MKIVDKQDLHIQAERTASAHKLVPGRKMSFDEALKTTLSEDAGVLKRLANEWAN